MGNDYTLRAVKKGDVVGVLAIIDPLSQNGRLLARTTSDVEKHLEGFAVAALDGEIIACGELRIYNRHRMAEVWSWGVLPGFEGWEYDVVVMSCLILKARRIGVEKVYTVSDRVGVLKKMGFRTATAEERGIVFLRPQDQEIPPVISNDDVRTARAGMADIPTIRRLIEDEAQRGNLLSRPWMEIIELVTKGRFLVAREGQKIVGCAGLDVYNREQGELRSLVVLSQYGGQKIGSALIVGVCRMAKRLGIEELSAVTGKAEVFLKLGFAYTSELLQEAWWVYPRTWKLP